jgi:hypothetical protein
MIQKPAARQLNALIHTFVFAPARWLKMLTPMLNYFQRHRESSLRQGRVLSENDSTCVFSVLSLSVSIGDDVLFCLTRVGPSALDGVWRLCDLSFNYFRPAIAASRCSITSKAILLTSRGCVCGSPSSSRGSLFSS